MQRYITKKTYQSPSSSVSIRYMLAGNGLTINGKTSRFTICRVGLVLKKVFKIRIQGNLPSFNLPYVTNCLMGLQSTETTIM